MYNTRGDDAFLVWENVEKKITCFRTMHVEN